MVNLVATYRSVNSVYIVLEYLAGGNLDEFIKRHKRTSLKDFIILDYLHQVTFLNIIN